MTPDSTSRHHARPTAPDRPIGSVSALRELGIHYGCTPAPEHAFVSSRRSSGGDAGIVGDQAPQGNGGHGVTRCFKCPKERRGNDPDWHFMDIQDRRGRLVRFRIYVCPRDYVQFAATERIRWMAVSAEVQAAPSAAPSLLPLRPVSGPNELIATLSTRGLTGWAYMVRDVAEGRVRRLYLRQLPADPEIRQALVAYLKSAGAEITIARGLV